MPKVKKILFVYLRDKYRITLNEIGSFQLRMSNDLQASAVRFVFGGLSAGFYFPLRVSYFSVMFFFIVPEGKTMQARI